MAPASIKPLIFSSVPLARLPRMTAASMRSSVLVLSSIMNCSNLYKQHIEEIKKQESGPSSTLFDRPKWLTDIKNLHPEWNQEIRINTGSYLRLLHAFLKYKESKIWCKNTACLNNVSGKNAKFQNKTRKRQYRDMQISVNLHNYIMKLTSDRNMCIKIVYSPITTLRMRKGISSLIQRPKWNKPYKNLTLIVMTL